MQKGAEEVALRQRVSGGVGTGRRQRARAVDLAVALVALWLALLLWPAPGHAAPSRPEPALDCSRFTEPTARLACAAANGGDPKSQVEIGISFASGTGVAVDYAAALRLFRLAADQGDAAGEAYLGSMYASGRGVARDDATAVRLMRDAADKGNAIGQVDLADMYVNGRGVPKDDEAAIRLYRHAAEQGNVYGMNSLAWRLAVADRNLDEALAWATRAETRQPRSGDIEDTLGWILYRQEKVGLALPHAQAAVALAPLCASCEDHLGDILAVRGDRAEARRHWQRALELSAGKPPDPDWSRAAVERKLAAP